MIKKRFHSFCAFILLALLLVLAWPTAAGSNYILRKHTFGNGGGQLQSAAYVLNGTIGQPSAVGELHGSVYRLQAGYWAGDKMDHRLYLPVIVR